MTTMKTTATVDEQPQARPGLRKWLLPDQYRPWQGRATSTDLALLAAFAGVLTLGFVVKPIKPFLLASHPVVLEILSGDALSIGAAAAFARIGEAPLWLVVIAGVIGMAKFDWLMWWAGRQWGEGIFRMFTTRERARRYADRATTLNPWIVRIAVVAAFLPGIPAPIVYAIAGIAGMRLATFLILDLVGAVLITSLIAGLGYWIGQGAVDLVLLIDRYALAVSLTLITVTFLAPWLRGRIRRSRRRVRVPKSARSRSPCGARRTGSLRLNCGYSAATVSVGLADEERRRRRRLRERGAPSPASAGGSATTVVVPPDAAC